MSGGLRLHAEVESSRRPHRATLRGGGEAMQQSLILATPPADPEAARRHFAAKFVYECDAADVYEDLSNGVEGIVVVDARPPGKYAEGHVPGAVSFPHRT